MAVSLIELEFFKEETMKKCILVFLCVFLCFGISSAQAVHYTTGAAMDIAVRDFDTLYPGLTQEMKDNIWMSYVSGDLECQLLLRAFQNG